MFPKLTPVTRNIIILNVVIFALSNFVFPQLYDYFSAFYPFSPNFRSYQIFTHMFMHAPLGSGAGITHILFNMFALWSFGPVLEQVLGSKRYIILYFASGLGAFLLFNVWNFYEVQQLTSQLEALGVNVADIYHKSDFSYLGSRDVSYEQPGASEKAAQLRDYLMSPMLGASGAIFGVIAAFAGMFPNAKLVFFPLPIPIKAKFLVPIIIVLSIYLGVSGSMGGVAHFAHVGGAVVGFLMSRFWRKDHFNLQ